MTRINSLCTCIQNFTEWLIFHARQFDTVTPILRILFVPAMLKALASELGRLTNRPFL
jgi:hypothetical protein